MIYAIVAAFIILDFVSGLVKAVATSSFESAKMREGLWHKVGLVVIIILALLVDYAQSFINLGFNLPISGAVCAYIILMEISSIIENACKINPEIMPEKLVEIFGGGHNGQ